MESYFSRKLLYAASARSSEVSPINCRPQCGVVAKDGWEAFLMGLPAGRLRS